MSSDSHRSSHATAWTLSLLIGLPLLYVLTLPPLIICVVGHPGTSPSHMAPKWLEVYAAPANWLFRHTPLSTPLKNYFDWYFDQFAPPTSPLAP